MQEQLLLLDNTIITSVALDASAVFQSHDKVACPCTNNSIDQSGDIDLGEVTQESKNNTRERGCLGSCTDCSERNYDKCKRRKCVKSKAVIAMSEDGVDIGSYIPKTIDEILPLISNGRHHSGEEFNAPSIIDTTSCINYETNGNECDTKPVDKLIVLCSCGDEMKCHLARQSKSIEEWSIDPPTTAAKNGEGDAAYRRVSLEVRTEVNILMDRMVGW